MRSLRLLTLALATLGILACLQSCKDSEDYQMDDQEFVTRASSSNTFEILAGTMATAKSRNSLVQQFGSHMIEEHNLVGIDLKAMAEAKGLSITTDLQAKEQANLATLYASTAGDFDKAFLDMMVAAHQEAISFFESASSNSGARDGDLRNFAAAKLPALRKHLQDAQALQQTLNR